MLMKLTLSCVTVVAIGVGLALAVTCAEAHDFNGYPGSGFGLFFGSPGYPDDGYYGNDYYDNGYYNDGYYDNGYYGGYHHLRRHVSYRCHTGTIRYHHRIHDARICNGHVTKVY